MGLDLAVVHVHVAVVVVGLAENHPPSMENSW